MTFVSKKSGSKKIVWRIAAALMVSAAPFAMSEKVSAQSCTPATSAANPVNNTTITCTGGTITANGSAGYGTGNEAGNQVTVDSSATVTGAVNGFLLGDANTITNNGTIAASGANGVAINAAIPGGSADVTVTNSKTIQATASGGTAIQASQVFLFNAATGTISADSVAVNGTGLSGSSVSMAAGGRGNFGLIEATGAGGIAIKSAADVNIENFGRIEAKTAGGTAIQAANRALGVNRAGGTITGGATGISAATLDVTNDGTISGGSVGITGAGSITNSGAISGGTVPGQGSVVFIGAGINTLTLQTGSKLTGDAVGSTSGATNKLVLQGSGTADNNFLNFNLLDVQATTAWALNGNADVQTATVSSGTLIVDTSGTLNGNVTINSGTQLTGTGKIAGNVNVMQKALLAPGAGIGKLTVTGNVNFAPDSIFFITATPARTSTSLAVGGNAVLAGSVQVQALGNFKPTTMYTILTAAGGLGGTRFDGGVSTTTASAFVTPTLSYDATDVFLTLDLINTPGAGAGFASAAQTRNQLAVASALDAAPTSNSLVGKLLILSADGARAAFNALSGEVFGSVHNTQAQEGSFTRSGVLGRLRQASYADAPGELGALGFAGPELAYADGRAPGNGNAAADGRTASAVDGKLAYAADANGSMAADLPVKAPRGGYNNGRDLTFWAQGLGGWGHSDSDGNAASLKSRFGGFLSGADMRFGEVWRAGLVAGYTRSDLKADARGSSAGIDSVTVGLYAGGRLGAFNLRTGASFSYDSIDVSRSVIFPGFSDATKTHFHGQVGQLFGEVGYGMGLGTFALEPFAGLAYVHLHDGSFLESGGIAALSGSSAHEDIGYSSLGIRAATFVPLGNGTVLVPRASAQWQHAFGDVTPTTAFAFQSTGTAFTVAGIPIARDSALVETGLDWRLSPWTKLGAFYQGELAAHAQSHAIKGGFTLDF